MDEQRILKEAQLIAAKFSFWMVSGNIHHLFGYPYETPEKKYELEIKFDDQFPDVPPNLIFHEDIIELLGDTYLETVTNWTPQFHVVTIVEELKKRIENALKPPEEKKLKSLEIEIADSIVDSKARGDDKKSIDNSEEYITPDLDAYPPDFVYEQYNTPSTEEEVSLFERENNYSKPQPQEVIIEQKIQPEMKELTQPELYADHEELSVTLNTELGLIQQEYAYDQRSQQMGDISVYLTITLTKTFIIHINFIKYPEKPVLIIPEDIKKLIGDPYQSLNSLRTWNEKKPVHIIEVIRELESRLYFINDVEKELIKLQGEYHCNLDSTNLNKLNIKLVTYGFKEYGLEINLGSLPNAPKITLSPEIEQILNIPITELDSYKDWKPNESEIVEIVREIAWLIDKNSRINFEVDLLKDHYKNIDYNASTSILKMDMKGKMKSQDLTFQFEVDLPAEYPMTVPQIKIINEFELESHEKLKSDLQASLKDFFNDWTPYSYLVDLFNAISKKIFEVSVVSCVICHKIDCPTCNLKIAGSEKDTCHTDCPYCDRSYHKHCWEQTIRSFGKCGFCLKTPPQELMPN